MDAYVVSGTGTGLTELAAFDTALTNAGIQNYNLVELSSMLPPDTTVYDVERAPHTHDPGTVIPTVIADARTATTEQITAGIGWQQADEGGILVEHSGRGSESESECKSKITASLQTLRDNRPTWTNWGEPSHTVVTVDVDNPPACAVVCVTLPNAPLTVLE